jgi:cAMP-dependent protein kinase regulator
MDSSDFDTRMRGVLEHIVTDLLKTQPEDPIPVMLHHLEEMCGRGSKPLTIEEAEELGKLRNQARKHQEKSKKDDSDDSDGSSEDDEVAELPKMGAQNRINKGSRTSVSAEAYGKYNKKAAFQGRVIPKTQETKEKIKNRLKDSFMFSALEPTEAAIVIDAMEEKRFKNNDRVITENENGDELFVVEQGKLKCTKVIEGASKFLKHYEPGDAFGELALLYNAPRAATIEAEEDCLLWSLDRATFNHIVKDAQARKREKYEDFLKSVSLLSSMDHYERSKLADAIKEVTYNEGDYVIKQGEEGTKFFVIVEGDAIATKALNPGENPTEVMKYKPGDYFGELALLKNEPRAANVVCKSSVKCVTLERSSFKRLLGPLDEILRRNMGAYANYSS